MLTRQDNALQNFQQIWPLFKVNPKQQWLWRYLLVIRRQQISTSGFVLPTVAMVSLVVVLLTTAMVLRSFERSKYASNIRVDEAVLNAAAPGLDRARAKLDALFVDPRLPGVTPSDSALYKAIKTNPKYTFGDETRLKLAQEFNNQQGIQGNTDVLENEETLTTAWQFPVDTDNNGKYDSFTLYSIYFRSPSRATTGSNIGKFNRLRNPLEARTPPMARDAGGQCANALATSAGLVGDSSWYKSDGKLKKSLFVFVATVPNISRSDDNYEPYKGNKSFSALEFQQDRSHIPINNNAVWFQDDLEITPSTPFRLNGRVHTNANLLAGGHNGTSVQLYQVSSKHSCFYQQENAKITVGGNVGTGNVADTDNQTALRVDLYSNYADGSAPSSSQISGTNKSTSSPGGSQVAYNDAAYNQRITLMKQTALSYCQAGGNPCSKINPPQESTVSAISQYPEDVRNRFADRLNANFRLNTYNVIAEEIEIYLKNRTRRVPYAEITAPDGNAKNPYDNDNNNIDTSVFSSSPIEPPLAWRELTNTNLTLNTIQLEATWPEQQRQNGKETLLGDRVLVGNNLPGFWKDWSGIYLTAPKNQQFIEQINWTNPNDQPRYRSTQVQKVDYVGTSNRDGFWEEKAAENPNSPPNDPLANFGGLRVITGAGVYRNAASTITALNSASFLPTPTSPDAGVNPGNAPPLAGDPQTPYTLVWPDTMPMTGGVDQSTAPPDLRMRATAIYHYKQSSSSDQEPIACISSYYNPTNATTAQNGKYGTDNGLPWGSNGSNLPANPDITALGGGKSNNGVVYPAPYTGGGRGGAIATYLTELKAQAKMMLPNGRIVNEPLQDALRKLNSSGALANSSKPLSLSENSAIDTAICALKILDSTIGTPSNAVIPHGAIKEASFLDGRQVKALSQSTTSTDYDLDLEQRQPLEIRVTEINLDTDNTRGLTRKSLSTNEYLLPNSGIIYASRDDALRDDSSYTSTDVLNSATDFRLDSTRRPNGIRLVNGSNLSRTADNIYREAEKGLILATDLPVYVKGNFNMHRTPGGATDIEEFSDTLELNWSDFYTRAAVALNANFACRPGRVGCPVSGGDTWRPATIISDAITLLSSTFQDGFRDRGDFDLRHNAGSGAVDSRRINGFFDNSFVTSATWTGTDSFPVNKSSYLTNGVTPVQRRVIFSEYVMEICRKLPVEICGPNDWVVGYDLDGSTTLEPGEINLKVQDLLLFTAEVGKLGAGTTAQPALINADRRYARRVAFLRNADNNLLNASNNPIISTSSDRRPVAIGIDNSAKVEKFPYGGTTPREVANALWFKTTDNSTDPTQGSKYSASNSLFIKEIPANATDQPLLVPVLQIHSPSGSPSDDLDWGNAFLYATNWLQAAGTATTFNAGFVAGNTPSRTQEEPAGLHNFVCFLENWQGAVNIKGNFIQLRRSIYATAPFATILRDTATDTATATDNLSLFDYPINTYRTDNGTPDGTLPYYHEPSRQWGFDVALLSQSPDLFAQKFTIPSTGSPNEFFREINRDDVWIKTLLCAATASDRVGAQGATYTQYAVPDKNQRPLECQGDTANYPENPS